jgi:hypothetical protein
MNKLNGCVCYDDTDVDVGYFRFTLVVGSERPSNAELITWFHTKLSGKCTDEIDELHVTKVSDTCLESFQIFVCTTDLKFTFPVEHEISEMDVELISSLSSMCIHMIRATIENQVFESFDVNELILLTMHAVVRFKELEFNQFHFTRYEFEKITCSLNGCTGLTRVKFRFDDSTDWEKYCIIALEHIGRIHGVSVKRNDGYAVTFDFKLQ